MSILKLMSKFIVLTLVSIVFSNLSFANARSYQSDFSAGIEGWSVSGRDNLKNGALDVQLIDVFGMDIFNKTNPAVIGKYASSNQPIQFSVDINAEHIIVQNREVARTLVLELRNYNIAKGSDKPFYSVWVPLGTIGGCKKGYVAYSTVIPNPQAQQLPAGWYGNGGEDSLGNPKLPDGVSMQDILRDVTELSFTTYEPGMVSTFTYYQLKVKNIKIATLEPFAS